MKSILKVYNQLGSLVEIRGNNKDIMAISIVKKTVDRPLLSSIKLTLSLLIYGHKFCLHSELFKSSLGHFLYVICKFVVIFMTSSREHELIPSFLKKLFYFL